MPRWPPLPSRPKDCGVFTTLICHDRYHRLAISELTRKCEGCVCRCNQHKAPPARRLPVNWKANAVVLDLRRHLRAIRGLVADARELNSQRVWSEYLGALAITGLCTAVAFPLSPNVGLVTIVMFYLL